MRQFINIKSTTDSTETSLNIDNIVALRANKQENIGIGTSVRRVVIDMVDGSGYHSIVLVSELEELGIKL